jgi:hypothetical protein
VDHHGNVEKEVGERIERYARDYVRFEGDMRDARARRLVNMCPFSSAFFVRVEQLQGDICDHMYVRIRLA